MKKSRLEQWLAFFVVAAFLSVIHEEKTENGKMLNEKRDSEVES